MSDFGSSWSLSRKRFVDEVSGLDQRQLNWRMYPSSLSIGEMAIHVAGVEVSFGSQLMESPLDGFHSKVKSAATDGVVNDLAFPFNDSEITPDLVRRTLEAGAEIVEPLVSEANPEIRSKTIKSALGPMIDGNGAFARLGFHSAYHQGQAYLIKSAPGFPTTT